jgi:hypothetical protein
MKILVVPSSDYLGVEDRRPNRGDRERVLMCNSDGAFLLGQGATHEL